MKLRLMINTFIGLLLLVVLCISAAQARAQNQTPANTPLVGWTDPDTGLTWTTEDNGSDVNWNQANAYCSNLRLGGFSDWRLPNIDELQGIYDVDVNVGGRYVKGNLQLSGWEWSNSQVDASGWAWAFSFGNGERYSFRLGGGDGRTLCVRR
jgi:hypothetical protein